MALVARSCFMVSGNIASRIITVKTIIVNPKLPPKALDSAMTVFIMGCMAIKFQISPIPTEIYLAHYSK